MIRGLPTQIRFYDKVLIGDECWEWQAGLNHYGYGAFRANGRMVGAHRWAWEHQNGPIPDGLHIDHLCRNRKCVNVAHMELVTPIENIKRGEVGKYQTEKTHCPQGHPYSGDNLYVHPNGARGCRACRSEAVKQHKIRKKELS